MPNNLYNNKINHKLNRVQTRSINIYHVYKLNQVLTTSTKLICSSIGKNITNFFKKIEKIRTPPLTQLL